MKLRSFHRYWGLILSFFLLISAATGFLRANAKGWYWKDRQPKKEMTSLSLPPVGIEEVFRICREDSPGGKIFGVQLKKILDKPVYLVETDRQSQKYTLLDAVSGEILSPLGAGEVLEIARLFGDGNAQSRLIERLPSFKAWKSSPPRPVLRILFDDRSRTEVFVDEQTGEALAVLDRGRRFGLWVVKFHELDFPGMGRPALSFLGVSLMILAASGLAIGAGLGQNKKKGGIFQ